jgi:DNA-binding response OmpR family regulator
VLDLAAIHGNNVLVVQLMHERTHTPIVVLGSRRDDQLRLPVLRAGADDYLVKPCNVNELEARIFAILRRIAMTRQSARSAYIQLDPSNRSVLVNQRHIDTTPMEFAILSTLMATPGRVFSRKELTALMFGEQYSIGRAIDVHISNIRSKIEENPEEPKYIVTVYGRGYMFKDVHAQPVA